MIIYFHFFTKLTASKLSLRRRTIFGGWRACSGVVRALMTYWKSNIGVVSEVISLTKFRTFPFSSDSAHNSVAYDPLKTSLSESEAEVEKPIKILEVTHCNWFSFGFCLPPKPFVVWFSLDGIAPTPNLVNPSLRETSLLRSLITTDSCFSVHCSLFCDKFVTSRDILISHKTCVYSFTCTSIAPKLSTSSGKIWRLSTWIFNPLSLSLLR